MVSADAMQVAHRRLLAAARVAGHQARPFALGPASLVPGDVSPPSPAQPAFAPLPEKRKHLCEAVKIVRIPF